VLKVNTLLKYATDSLGGGAFALACAEADVPMQRYVVRSDLRSGSTVGPMTAALTGATTVDVGAPLVSMHSSRELCAVVEPARYAAALAAFLARTVPHDSADAYELRVLGYVRSPLARWRTPRSRATRVLPTRCWRWSRRSDGPDRSPTRRPGGCGHLAPPRQPRDPHRSPRGDISRPLAGVFATRSPDRPNPIGLHRCQVLAVDGTRLTVAVWRPSTAHRSSTSRSRWETSRTADPDLNRLRPLWHTREVA
jgi:hypothetical protein